MLFLLDTNILLAYIRYSLLGQYIEATYSLYTMQPTPTISVITEGEARAFALKRGWGAARMASLQQRLNPLTIIPLPYRNVVEAYARIDNHCEKHGFALSQNDLWIAATAHVSGATLLTTDRDFDPLDGVFLQRTWIDPNSRL